MLPILLQFCVILSHTILYLNSESGTARLPNLASIFDEQFVEPSQNSYNPSISVYLSEYKYQGANVLIADRTFSLASQSSATIIFADNSKTESTTTTLSSMPSKNAKPTSILVLQNSTVSLQHLSFIIHRDMNAIQNKNVACALLTESHLTSSNCVFEISGSTPPFIVTSSSSVSLISNTFKSTSGPIPSITCIDSDTDQPITLDTSVVSLMLESVEVATAKSFLISTISSNSHVFLNTAVSSAVFNNVSSSHPFERATNGLTIRQQMHQTRLTNVDNALEGTILSSPSNSLYFGVGNSTFIDCMNEEESQSKTNPNDVNVTGTFNVTKNTASQFTLDAEGEYVVLFASCKFFIETPSSSTYSIITIKNFMGNATFLNTEFEVNGSSSTQQAVYFTSVYGAPSRLNVFSSRFYFSSTHPSGASGGILRIVSGATVTISDCIMTALESDKPSLVNAIYATSFHGPILIASTEFSKLRFSSEGGVFYMDYGVTHCTDCLFEGNEAKTLGGVLRSQNAIHYFHRCMFRNNLANTRGGVFRLSSPKMVYYEDCHFEGNKALDTVAYRGNDIYYMGTTPKVFYTQTVVGCTSDSASSKIGYYYSSTSFGNLATENTLLPSRVTGKPALDFVLYVAIPVPEPEPEPEPTEDEPSERNQEEEECSKELPCETLQPALTRLTKAESPAINGKSMIDIGIGTFRAEATQILTSLEMVGKGWLVNSTAYTLLQSSGFEVVGAGNVSFRGLSLKPNQDYRQALVTISSNTAFLRLSNTRIECLADYPSPVLVLSGGQTQLYDTHFASISLTTSAAIQISGSASLETFIVTFNYISRASGNGGSCIDSTSTGFVNMTMTDARHCRSTGRAGCYDFEDLTSKAKVNLVDCLFIFNLANINPDGTVATPGMKFGHDYATTGLLAGNVVKDTATVRTRSSLNYHVLTNTTQSNLFYANVHYYGYATPMPFGERSAYGVHLADFTGFQVILDQMLKGTTQTMLRLTLVPGTSIPFDPIVVDGQNLQIYQPTVYPTDYTKPLALITSGTLYLYSINIQMQQEFSVPIIQVLNKNTKFQTNGLTFTANEFQVSHVPFVTSVDGTLVHTTIRFRPESFTFEGCSMYELKGGAVTLTQWLVNNIDSTTNGAIVNCVGTNITVSQGTFKNITAPNGAVFHVEMTEYNFIQATHAATTTYTETFTQCTAVGDGTVEAPTGKGGVFYIKGPSSAKLPLRFNTTDKNHARFENNKAQHGNDIYIEDTLYTDSQIAELTGFGGNSLSAYYRVVFEGKEDLEDKKEMERLNFFLEIPVISVNGTGTDSTDCKWTSSYCKTLGWGITLLHFRFKNQTHMPRLLI
ncbi:hypothetical protein BLNAU_3054 [Blattamonas nauphoetae]|uniref:Uncharacterized protein n=1 Tax=Blattamonas nauphoetae TaxID=2049346 RepID=A0ABQ9YE01_9EUKA|nr:hypothetical protein BLNAU_3054 [Blattamonas nauphoetae]